MQYQRTCSIERAEGETPAGQITGVLATDGEASDGHILNMDGVTLPERAPLLFGHDDFTGTGNLGSWTGFERFKGKGLGGSGIRGSAQIELDGEGTQQQWRADVHHMIEKGHIGQFSVRWEETAEPMARVDLPNDHPAFVDGKKSAGRKRWGMYFDKWRLLEGSVVTLGADPAALVGRMQQAEGDVRSYWRAAINHALTEREEVAGLIGVDVGTETIYIERAVYEALLEEANARMMLALDLHEETNDASVTARADLEAALAAREESNCNQVEPVTGDEPVVTLERESQAARLPAIEAPSEIARMLREGLEEAAREIANDTRVVIRQMRGRVE